MHFEIVSVLPVAGYGIQLVTAFQDTAQMQGQYKLRWASFIGDARVRALFDPVDFDTAEYRLSPSTPPRD